jgi:DNA primase
MPAIQGLNDKLERVAVANDLASYLGVEPGLVLDHFRKVATDRTERSSPPKTDPSRATDRILLPLLVNDGQAREQLIEHLRDLPALKLLNTAPIYEILITMHDAGEMVDFNTLHARIPPSLQENFSAIVLDSGSGEATLEDGLACVEALQREARESIRRNLKVRIKSAEREGRMNEALELIRELSYTC